MKGMFHARQMVKYGTKVVAGVTPGKGGQDIDEVPVFNTVTEAVTNTGANATAIFVPPAFAADAILEAADSGNFSHRVSYRGNPNIRDGERPGLSKRRRG